MENQPAAQPVIEVRNTFVRGRNTLLSHADFSSLYVDYYLHIKDHAIEVEIEHAEIFKRALAAFTLHCASHPRHESIAWTLNFQQPLLNLFMAGDTGDGTITGRTFSDNVKQSNHNSFFQEIIRLNKPLRRSYVDFQGADPLAAAEAFYRQSEQRPARFFDLGEDKFAMVGAHPDYDAQWFNQLDIKTVINLEETEELNLIERRAFRWYCGCNQRRLLELLATQFLQDADALFQNEETLQVHCPRCTARYRVTRETLEAYVANDYQPQSRKNTDS